MDTLKTGFIVLLLLAVLYGVYVVLNKDQSPPNAEIAWHQQQAEKELQIDITSPNDSVKVADGSSKPAAEPKLLSPPVAGTPSTVSAELSPPVDPPTKIAAEPSAPPKPASVSALNETSNGLKPVPAAAPVPAIRAAADSSTSEISAPSLLASRPKSESKAPAKGSTTSTTTEPPRDLASLPALRESPGGWPESKSAEDANSATKAPDAIDPGAAPTTSNPAPLLADAGAPEKTPATTDLTASAPSDSKPDAVTEATAGLKSITTAAAFDAALREAQSNLSAEQWYQALFVLSKFYGSPDLSPQQERELIDLLDPLAAKVIYSQEHLITDAHEVRRGDTLAQIAAANQVPPELLSNINGVENPDLLVPGTKLKVVRGPFRADVNLQKKELTLFAGQLYAGRFPITVGHDPEPQPGEFRVVEKQPGHDYFPAMGQRLAAEDPQNPFGRVWISLGKDIAIHGSPERGDSESLGCISLSPLDAADVYSILTQGSSVTIRK